jgi:hypothetical protein
VRQKETKEKELGPFGPAEGSPPVLKTLIQPGRHSWTVIRNLAKDESRLEIINDEGGLSAGSNTS